MRLELGHGCCGLWAGDMESIELLTTQAFVKIFRAQVIAANCQRYSDVLSLDQQIAIRRPTAMFSHCYCTSEKL